MRQVIAGVQTAFVDAQYAKENLKLAQENLRSLEGVVSINEARLNSGDLAQVELDRSRVAALQYRTAVQLAELQLDQAKSRLQLLMGQRQKSADFDVTGEIRNDAAAPSASDIERLALSRRPDYLSDQRTAHSRADLRLQLANAKVDYVIGTEYTRQVRVGYLWQLARAVLGAVCRCGCSTETRVRSHEPNGRSRSMPRVPKPSKPVFARRSRTHTGSTRFRDGCSPRWRRKCSRKPEALRHHRVLLQAR